MHIDILLLIVLAAPAVLTELDKQQAKRKVAAQCAGKLKQRGSKSFSASCAMPPITAFSQPGLLIGAQQMSEAGVAG